MRQQGLNLIELIVAIVIISIACMGVLLVFAQTVRHSADPMVQQQAVAVAEGYLDEILARPVADPDGTNAGETRATYDNVADYAAIVNEQPPRDQNGIALPGLDDYRVDVAVTPGINVGGVNMAQVDVRVRYGGLVDLTLTGYRAE